MNNSHTSPAVPCAADLVQTGPLQQRSLSLPLSRIVLNPQDFVSDASEVEQNCDSTLPLGLGYYAFDQAITIPRFLSLWALAPGGSSQAESHSAAARIPAADWMAGDHVRVETDGAALVVSLIPDSPAIQGCATTRVRLDERVPVLRIAVRAVTGQMALHLADDDSEPVMLLPGAATAGLRYLDLRELLPAGLAGDHDLILSVIGAGAEVVVDELALVPAMSTETVGALGYETDWSPGGLGLTGRYPTARMKGRDALVDRDSVVRELEFDAPLSPDTQLTLVGRHIATPVHDSAAGTVTMAAEGMCAVVAIAGGGQIRYYTDESELAAGGEGSPVPSSSIGVWAVPLSPGHCRYRIGCGLTPDDPARAAALALAASRVSAAGCQQHWLRYWDDLLARVPHPSSFELQGVDAGDLDPATVSTAYYHAFVGLYSNVLPPQPETGFEYPTIATGKGSMWNHGAPGARSAAAWETFLATQFLAYADADLAWLCFNGLMSLVDAEGSLAGEGLPSRKAQTAWVLYSLTHGRRALETGYPALRRLLLWQAAHPRWVYGSYDNAGEQDAEFLSSAIIDLGFGSQIARVLGKEEDARQFDQIRDELSRDYANHCFAGPRREAIQHWFPDDDSASLRGGPSGWGLQVVMGLAIPGLTDWQVNSLLTRFDAHFDSDAQLAGFDFVKHPNVGYTVSGLLEHHRRRQAVVLLNAVLRDVVRSGSFAEVYDRGAGRPRPWGVRPSIFGMTQVIDAVWLNNGLRMDLGVPHAVALPGSAGAVEGIPVVGRRIALVVQDRTAILTDPEAPSDASSRFVAAESGTAFPLSMGRVTAGHTSDHEE